VTTRGGRGRQAVADAGPEGEVALRAEIEQLRGKAREQAMLIDRLQRRLGRGYAVSAPANGTGAEGEVTRAQREISEAEGVIGAVRAATSEGDANGAVYEREIRVLKANVQDQAGEIARLKAALAAFEQGGQSGGLKDSRIALKARLGSAQALVDQQTATIGKLRAELAATHERLARQAAHFMGEMRRIGTGGTASPGAGQPRQARAGGRNLAERVGQAHTVAPPGGTVADAAAPSAADAKRTDPANANGRNGKVESTTNPTGTAADGASAAEMPKAPEIPEKRRRPTLIDRITGVGKS
jgi:hypothetical protein